jgi:chromosome partitioning protein
LYFFAKIKEASKIEGMARVIAVYNAKGGVGKTTTAVNLGAYLALLGKRTLLVDFDPQANASSAVGSDRKEVGKSVYHGLVGEVSPADLVAPSSIFNFHLVPSTPHLSGALVELVAEEGREYFLRRFVDELRGSYDYILIDLPPTLSLLTINGLVAADEVLIPLQAEYYSLEGAGQLLETMRMVQENLHPALDVTGVVITMFNPRSRLSREVAENVRAYFGKRAFSTVIPRSVSLAEAPGFGKPVALHRPGSSGARAYENLAREIIAKEPESIMNQASGVTQNHVVDETLSVTLEDLERLLGT